MKLGCISGMCIAPNIDINLRSGQFWATFSFVQRKVKWFQILLDNLYPRGVRATVKILFASVSSGSRTLWPNRERCCAWTMVERQNFIYAGVKITYRNSRTKSGLLWSQNMVIHIRHILSTSVVFEFIRGSAVSCGEVKPMTPQQIRHCLQCLCSSLLECFTRLPKVIRPFIWSVQTPAENIFIL